MAIQQHELDNGRVLNFGDGLQVNRFDRILSFRLVKVLNEIKVFGFTLREEQVFEEQYRLPVYGNMDDASYIVLESLLPNHDLEEVADELMDGAKLVFTTTITKWGRPDGRFEVRLELIEEENMVYSDYIDALKQERKLLKG